MATETQNPDINPVFLNPQLINPGSEATTIFDEILADLDLHTSAEALIAAPRAPRLDEDEELEEDEEDELDEDDDEYEDDDEEVDSDEDEGEEEDEYEDDEEEEDEDEDDDEEEDEDEDEDEDEPKVIKRR